MIIEEFPVDRGPRADHLYVLVVDGTDVGVLESTRRLVDYYAKLRGKAGVTVKKRDAVNVPTFLKLSGEHPVLKQVKNWRAIFGNIQ